MWTLAKVDPYQNPIPPTLESGLTRYLENLDRFLKDLWERTGGGDDLVEKSDVTLGMGVPVRGHLHDVDHVDHFHYGLGAPDDSLGDDGDFYFRSDGALNTRIYHKGSGTWTAIT